METDSLNKNIEVLLVEDNPGDARLIHEMLKEGRLKKFHLDHVERLSQGVERLAEGGVDVILLDLSLPDSHGMETFARMRQATPGIPIVVLTGINDEKLAMKAIVDGAQDYLVKSLIDGHSLSKALLYAIERHRLVEGLRAANVTILAQQKRLVEDERLKVMLQMAGATAHELNQPLMALLGNIELMRISGGDDPGKLARHMDNIQKAGQRIDGVVKQIMRIHSDEINPYPGSRGIINIDQKIAILSVEDSDTDYQKLKSLLQGSNEVQMDRARGIDDALSVLEKVQYELIFLDYQLPDGTGMDFLKTIEKKGIETPVVVITGQGDEVIASQVLQAGAYDYLPKNKICDKSLSRVIANTMEKARLKREIKNAAAKMAEMAIHDELTGLYNRRYFMEALGREMERANRYGKGLGIFFMDLDFFKNINDTYGHVAGDMVLSEVGRILRQCNRGSDISCRYGGEEFAVILPELDVEGAQIVSERIRKMIGNQRILYDGSEFQCTVSIGVALYTNERIDAIPNLIDRADRALYTAKKEGRNRVVGASPESVQEADHDSQRNAGKT